MARRNHPCQVLNEGYLLGGTRYYPVWQAAEILRVSSRCIRYRIERGEFSGVVAVPVRRECLGFAYLIPASEVHRHRDHVRK